MDIRAGWSPQTFFSTHGNQLPSLSGVHGLKDYLCSAHLHGSFDGRIYSLEHFHKSKFVQQRTQEDGHYRGNPWNHELLTVRGVDCRVSKKMFGGLIPVYCIASAPNLFEGQCIKKCLTFSACRFSCSMAAWTGNLLESTNLGWIPSMAVTRGSQVTGHIATNKAPGDDTPLTIAVNIASRWGRPRTTGESADTRGGESCCAGPSWPTLSPADRTVSLARLYCLSSKLSLPQIHNI